MATYRRRPRPIGPDDQLTAELFGDVPKPRRENYSVSEELFGSVPRWWCQNRADDFGNLYVVELRSRLHRLLD